MTIRLTCANSIGRVSNTRRLLMATSILAGFSGTALADPLPAGGVVAAGSATIATGSTTLTVTQTTPRAVVNWGSFDIDAGNKVTFNQPDAGSAMLNRVTGASASIISGMLSANGAVFLVNPNGIALTSTGNVQTGGGFVASTLAISDADFMAGTLKFTGTGSSPAVTNAGKIHASPNKFVALLGGSVANSGSIAVSTGRVGLASGEQVTLDLNGAGFMQVAVPSSVAGTGALVQSSGTIIAQGGLVVLQAATVKDVVRNVINMPGTINADSAVSSGGKVLLLGGAGGTVTGTGSIYARATGASGDGGSIETTGQRLGVNLLRTYTTAAGATGRTGTWTLGSEGFTVAPSGGDMTGARLGTVLASNNVLIRSVGRTPGDIAVNDAVTWATGNALTLSSFRDVSITKALTASGNNAALYLIADNTGTGTGTVTFGAGINATLTGTGTTAKVYYNPATFGSAINYDGNIVAGKMTAYQLVNTAAKLQSINNFLSGNFALSRDIDASTIANFVPLGTNGAGTVTNSGNGFTGSFDGVGRVVDRLTVSRGTSDYVGLFGAVGGGTAATIENLTLTNIKLTGASYIGGLIGANYNTATGGAGATIRNVSVAGTVTGRALSTYIGSLIGGLIGYSRNVDITDAATQVTVAAGPGTSIGGLIGANDGGSIARSRATGNVSAAVVQGRVASGVGGLIGYQVDGSITDSFATGNVTTGSIQANNIGGLVGTFGANGTVQRMIVNSWASGAVSTGKYSTNVGGLAGEVMSTMVLHAYASGPVYGGLDSENVGGLIGLAQASTLDDAHATGPVSGSSQVGGLVGWSRAGSIANSHATGSVTQIGSLGLPLYGNVYRYLGGLVGGNESTLQNVYATGNVSGAATNQGGGLVGYNTGAITKAYATGNVFLGGRSTDAGGLVGQNEGGSIAESHATGTVTANSQVGGLVGNVSRGTISGSWANGAVSGFNGVDLSLQSAGSVGGLIGYSLDANVSNSYALGTATGTAFIGGLIGSALNPASKGRISGVYATGAVNGRSSVGGLIGLASNANVTGYATGGVTGNETAVGGLIGTAYKSLTNLSYATGNVTAGGGASEVGGLIGWAWDSTTNNSHATGTVTADHMVGGLIGRVVGGSVNGSWASGAVSGVGVDALSGSHIGGLIGANGGKVSGRIEGDGGNVTNSQALGAVSGVTKIGGLIGSTTGTTATQLITGVRATGPVTGVNGSTLVGGLIGSATKSVVSGNAAGAVTVGTGSSNIGGLIGSIQTGSSSQSFATGNVTAGVGSFNIGGLIGLSTASNNNNTYATGNVTGSSKVGGLIGRLDSNSLSGAYATGNVTQIGDMSAGASQSYDGIGGLVGLTSVGLSNVRASGMVTAGDRVTNVGGLVGQGGFLISNAYATGNVIAPTARQVGGLAGFMSSGTITGSYATGAVTGASQVGGLVGNSNFVTIQSAHAEGAVSGQSYVGGLLGSSSGVIGDSHATGPVTGFTYVGGLIGNAARGTVQNSHADGAVTAAVGDGPNRSFLGGLIGWSYADVTGSYATGAVTSLNSGQFIGGLIGQSRAPVLSSYASGPVVISRTSELASIGYVGGLIGATWSNGGTSPKVASVTASYALGNVTINGAGNRVGGLIGSAENGIVARSYATGNVTSGDSSGSVGGLVGLSQGFQIRTSYATGNVSVGLNSASIGGLAGITTGDISDAYATGAVTTLSGAGNVGGLVGWARTVSRTYSIGSVSTGPNSLNVGGLIGYLATVGGVTSSYWNIETSGLLAMCGGSTGAGCSNAAGLTTSQMQDFNAYATTYSGWDFTSVWTPPNQAGQNGQAAANYPRLP